MGHESKGICGHPLSWVIRCARRLFFPLSVKATLRWLACCPLSWISLPHWPPCSSLKSQSRKTPALICYDGFARHPDSIWKTEKSCLEGWEELFMLTKNTQQFLPSSKMIGQIQRSIASVKVCSSIGSANICINHSISVSQMTWWLESQSNFGMHLRLQSWPMNIMQYNCWIEETFRFDYKGTQSQY